MKIVFEKQEPSAIIEALRENLGGRKLGKMVDFSLGADNKLEVTIKKMGTSQLIFSLQDQGKLLQWDLTQEKIALAHRAFRGEVMEKLVKVIGQIGGRIIS